jgi:hypothetical protein
MRVGSQDYLSWEERFPSSILVDSICPITLPHTFRYVVNAGRFDPKTLGCPVVDLDRPKSQSGGSPANRADLRTGGTLAARDGLAWPPGVVPECLAISISSIVEVNIVMCQFAFRDLVQSTAQTMLV